MKIQEELRAWCASIRTRPTPLAEAIPMVQRAAGALEAMQELNEAHERAGASVAALLGELLARKDAVAWVAPSRSGTPKIVRCNEAWAKSLSPEPSPVYADRAAQSAAADLKPMISAAWIAGYYDAGYTHDSAYADARSTKYADEVLAAAPSPAATRTGD